MRVRFSHWLQARQRDVRSWTLSLILHGIILLFVGLTVWLPAGRGSVPLDLVITDLLDGDLQEVGSDNGFLDGLGPVGDAAEVPEGEPIVRWDTGRAVEIGGAPASELANGLFPRVSAAVTAATEVVEDDEVEVPVKPNGKGSAKLPSVGSSGGTKGKGKALGANVAGLLDGRGDEARAALVKKGGGTKETERAVDMGLAWLARQQRSDGSWSFQHGPDNPGTFESSTGATGLALMA
ncbi:MAG: hypothetical protein JSS02_17760, partial [Planctomycetes bacterium]|nr:hypothetical protein [Planctomycetota bacterium]